VPKGRLLVHYRLRPDTIQAYIRCHEQIEPELLALYREAGITEISCFLSGLDLMVYVQVEQERYEAAKEALDHSPLERSWQARMRTLHDPQFQPQHFQEVYRLPSAGPTSPAAGENVP